ncbi:MAG TPA: glycoside hydrolase family 15 protein [Thermoanaerobaculia bacterium]|nr:glycoside hydrolase family 15 protein [Thermoanaerobaculia bacterium]
MTDRAYPPIEHHGVIGDLHTVALVTLDGSIDWLCLPHFDSPSIFGALLDSERGGSFRISATSEEARRRQMYLPDSNVLVTRFLTPDGVGEVVDFMPIRDSVGPKRREDHQIVRIVRGVRGVMPFRMECRPSFEYGRRPGRASATDFGCRFASDSDVLSLATGLPLALGNDGAGADFELHEGEEIPFLLSQSADPPVSRERLAERCNREFHRTLRYWQDWIARSHYAGRWREMVKRSCLALKLLTFEPSGAIVAAPTMSLPERIGGPRNWDYRYTWVRDAAFTVYAFLRVGFTDEARHFIQFLERRFRDLGADASLQVLYGVDGRTDLPESILEHLDGYRGSRPVRCGNDAARQFQLDIVGDLMDSVYLYNKYCEPASHDLWSTMRRLADWVCDRWQEPDEGIWEVRGGRQQFTFSKMMCWVALDRALRLAMQRSFPADLPRWIATRDQIYATIMERGFSRKKNSFVQRLDGEVLDASMLLAPLVKFVAPSDPRMLGTLDAMVSELESDHLVRRYDPRVSPDGLDGEEGTFSICTFWLAEALGRAGRVDEARLTFEKMLGYANHLGLFSEEIGLTGEALGNFPQAFTHLSLISAAVNISRALDGKPSGRHGQRPED